AMNAGSLEVSVGGGTQSAFLFCAVAYYDIVAGSVGALFLFVASVSFSVSFSYLSAFYVGSISFVVVFGVSLSVGLEFVSVYGVG
ncbi:hypothetical protein, partial [Robiginitalea biformata]|uniref:hypothetical protein n=1 Tax=Robiginitalea biformata TaxID=252307 RepID=UPI003D332BF7